MEFSGAEMMPLKALPELVSVPPIEIRVPLAPVREKLPFASVMVLASPSFQTPSPFASLNTVASLM